jgi:hypothetical protein
MSATPSPRSARASTERATSSALALASVTAVLKDLLENGLAARGITSALGGDASVSALPPDRVPSGADERAQLNLFLYAVTPYAGLRLVRERGDETGDARPTRGGRDDARAAPACAPPLALDLHYLLTAYGAQDFQAEILLGHTIQLLHERPVLDRPALRAALTALSSALDSRIVPPPLAALAASDLPERVERLTITPAFPPFEEMSRLWSVLQARYRPSAAYRVSAVLIGGEAR